MKKINSFLAFLICFLSLSLFSQNPTNKSDFTDEEKNYLKKFIYPLNSFEPDSQNNDDLKVLEKLTGNSKIVALGEVSHGSSEIYKMKDRLVRYLVPNLNFNIFSIEAAMTESYEMNQYVMNGKGDPKDFLKGMYFWVWQTEETLNMVNWMKKYNDSHPKKIQFTGFDMQFYEGALKEIRKFYTLYNEPQNDLDQLSDLISDVKNQTQKAKSGKTVITDEQKGSITALFSNLKSFSKKISNEKERKWYEQNIRIIEQYTDKSYKKRDEYMAENITWIQSQNPDSKIIVSAHNGHINNRKLRMGEYLDQNFRKNYVTFGFAFFKGSYTAFNGKKDDPHVEAQPAQTAYEGTLEYNLNSLDIPVFILDLKSLKKENNKLAKWIINDKVKFRQTGSTVRKEEFSETNITDDFDYLIFIKESTNSHLLKKK